MYRAGVSGRAARSVAAVLVIVAGASIGASAGSAVAERSKRNVNFLAHCRLSHTSNDDPIVHPRHRGRSHEHAFFGNRSTNAYSTLKSLRAARTTCTRPDETAAYWVPTLFKNGRRVRPSVATAYYFVREHADIRPYPPGLEVVAGDANATRPQPLDVVWWNCGAFGGVPNSSSVPRSCPKHPRANGGIRRPRGEALSGKHPATSSLELHVDFPNCWDGRRLDSRDHSSHMAYGTNWRCPRSHPVQVPRLILIVRYPIYDGRNVELSSGGQHTGHADFFNAWQQEELRRIVAACTRGLPRCARKRP